MHESGTTVQQLLELMSPFLLQARVTKISKVPTRLQGMDETEQEPMEPIRLQQVTAVGNDAADQRRYEYP